MDLVIVHAADWLPDFQPVGSSKEEPQKICVLYNDISRPKQADRTLSKKYQDVAYRLTVQLRPPNGIIQLEF